MNHPLPPLEAILSGASSAFRLSPADALGQYLAPASVESRLHRNFARVGESLERAMGKAANEQKTQQKTAR